MAVFLEKFILPVLAAIVVLVAITNPTGLEPMQRIIGASVLLLLAGVTAYIVHRYNRRSSPVAQQIKRPHSTPERNYVDVKPKYLVAFFKSHTAIQAEQIVAVYVGSWMRLSGSVGTVMNNGPSRWQLTFRFSSLRFLFGEPEPTVFMYFVGEKWATRLATLRREEKVIVDGRIRGVDVLAVHLENCEFVEQSQHHEHEIKATSMVNIPAASAPIAPVYLRNFFEQFTAVQATNALQDYIGKWMEVAGPVGDVISTTDLLAQVTFERQPDFYMFFRGPWKDRAKILKRGDNITAIGQITRIERTALQLDNCELVEKR